MEISFFLSNTPDTVMTRQAYIAGKLNDLRNIGHEL